jgi:putative heme-binding domain-containing protein
MFSSSSRRNLAVVAASTIVVVMVSTLPLLAQAPPGSAQMTPEQQLATHLKDENSGTAAAGRAPYEKLCAGCHRFGGIGKDVGPDLTTLTSRFKRKDILESILWPSKIISDQYQSEMLELTDGSIVTGVLVRENATALLIRTGENPDKPVVVTKARISNRAPSTVSLMPEGLLNTLSDADVANLLAFVTAPAPEK